MNQLTQNSVISAIRYRFEEMRFSAAANSAECPCFTLNIAAKQLLPADAAQQAIKLDDFPQANFADRESRSGGERSVADAAVGRK